MICFRLCIFHCLRESCVMRTFSYVFNCLDITVVKIVIAFHVELFLFLGLSSFCLTIKSAFYFWNVV